MVTDFETEILKARGASGRPEDLDPDGPVKKLAELLRNMGQEDRKEVLAALLTQDAGASSWKCANVPTGSAVSATATANSRRGECFMNVSS